MPQLDCHNDPVAPLSSSLWPSAERRDADRERKREILLQAAVTMFNERGFHNTSLDEIAAALGITKPVIYHHLGNKDQVLFQCVSHGLDLLRNTAGNQSVAQGASLEILRAFLIRYAEIIMSEFGRCVIRTDDTLLSPDSRSRFRALKREIDQALRERIAASMADGSIEARDVRSTTFTIAGALNWLARWYEPTGPESPERIAADTVELLLDGLRPRR